ncbi:PTS sugar transporter subunit IIA [Propionispira raffinosivorans]|uniref:PTS sugar transporter subunit IIA n=1 Tax=Propionispira raffinosivorans TaxID=86959 RepID=UPI0003724555|nr:PTS sugar transporter subunit IIA [Propionispira raffinosivorans]
MEKIFKFDETVIRVGIEAVDCYDALDQLANTLCNAGYVKKSYVDAIITREKIFPTGLPTGKYGVAIPHADICHVNSSMIAVGILKDPVEFKNMGDIEDTVSTKIIFMLAMNNSENQVKLLSAFMGNLQDQELLKNLAEAKNVHSVIKLIDGKIKF